MEWMGDEEIKTRLERIQAEVGDVYGAVPFGGRLDSILWDIMQLLFEATGVVVIGGGND